MGTDGEFRDYVLDQLNRMGEFETRNMFGGTAVLRNGIAFAKIKHGTLWLKVDEENVVDFTERGMVQYTYGKDSSRKLNFYEAPAEILEDEEMLTEWANRAWEAASQSRK
jgi:DNA transformation protein